MICAACGAAQADGDTATPPCAQCGANPTLADTYRLLTVLGQGAVATTYGAQRMSDGAPVAVKELLLRSLDTFKTKDLFHREAQVLRSLDHPAIPRYIDELTAGTGKHTAFYLVQELVEGRSLQAELAVRRYTEVELAALLAEICDILAYLHALRPAVIHRDLKPSNIMRRTGDGRLMLIDFGAVRAVAKTDGGSTVAGTFGFMAPEQFAGHATTATDLYGLGATAVALLTRRSPQELVDASHELRWREAVQVTPRFERILTDLLHRDPSQRAQDAATVGRRLRALAEGRPHNSTAASSKPQKSRENPGFSGEKTWSTQGRPPSTAAATGPGRAIVGPPSLGEIIRGKVAAGDMLRHLADGSLLSGRSKLQPPPELYRKPPSTPRPSGLWLVRDRDPMAKVFVLFGGLFGATGTFVAIPILASSLFGSGSLVGGLISAAVFGLFATVAGGFCLTGLHRLQQAAKLWRDGVEVSGCIENVELQRNVRAKGRVLWRVTYSYTIDGKRYGGVGTTFEPKMRMAQKGQPIALVVAPTASDRSLLHLG